MLPPQRLHMALGAEDAGYRTPRQIGGCRNVTTFGGHQHLACVEVGVAEREAGAAGRIRVERRDDDVGLVHRQRVVERIVACGHQMCLDAHPAGDLAGEVGIEAHNLSIAIDGLKGGKRWIGGHTEDTGRPDIVQAAGGAAASHQSHQDHGEG